MFMEEIQKLKEENERLVKLQSAKEDLFSVSAHQVKTSLSAIKWIIKMFLNNDLGKLTAEQENLLKKAYEDNDRAIATINELLLINRSENIVEKKYEFSSINIVELVDDCIFDFSGEAHTHNIEVIFLKPGKELPQVLADKEKLRIVIQNLLENAIKYSNSGGKIFLSLTEKSGSVEFSIKDTGIGISPEGRDKIFEKFYRDSRAEKKDANGSGIGLYTIKKIIEEHKGEIWFESNTEAGTTFYFTLSITK